MNPRKFASFEASLASRPDIEAEIAFLCNAFDPPEPRPGSRMIPVAVGCAVVLGSASQALAHQARHVVVAGESLYRIAQHELGSGSRWKEIAELNHLSDPARIQIGQILKMPNLGAARRFSIREVHARESGYRRTRQAIEIVPPGTIVERLPGRSDPYAATASRPSQGSRTMSARRPRHFATSHRFTWTAIDLSAFAVGCLAGLRLLALRRKPRRSAARTTAQASAKAATRVAVRSLESLPEPVLAGAATGPDRTAEFWNYVPGSGDLLALVASAS